MKTNHFVMILDVEGMRDEKPYNVGYLIGDRKGNIVLERSWALPNAIWSNLKNCLRAERMTKKNVEEILADFGSGDNRKYDYISNVDFMEQFKKDLEQYKISQVWAYNSNFDNGSITRLYDGRPMPDVTWCDIMSAACASICYKKKYVKFCMENGFVTAKGNIKYSAESVYAYLTNSPTFSEEHTGLADCHIEYQIYLAIIKKHKKLHKSLDKGERPWKELAEIRDTL